AALLPGQPQFGVDPLRWTLADAQSQLVVNIGLQAPQANPVVPWLATLRSLEAELVVSRDMAIELMTRFGQMPGGTVYSSPEQAREAATVSFDFMQRLALASGYVVQHGDNLVARMTYADGKASLNGEPV